jgi:hypothetical protein
VPVDPEFSNNFANWRFSPIAHYHCSSLRRESIWTREAGNDARQFRDRLALVQQLALDLQNYAINVVLDLVDLPALAVDVSNVHVGGARVNNLGTAVTRSIKRRRRVSQVFFRDFRLVARASAAFFCLSKDRLTQANSRFLLRSSLSAFFASPEDRGASTTVVPSKVN